MAAEDEDPPVSNSTTVECRCKRTMQHAPTVMCSRVSVSALMSGASVAALSDADRLAVMEDYMRKEWGNLQTGTFSASSTASQQLPSLVLEHWESGVTDVEPLLALPSMKLQGTTSLGGPCSEQVICHCGPRTCQALPDYSSGTPRTIRYTPTAGSSGSARRLLPAVHASSRTTEVVVIFGIQPPETSRFLDGVPKWSFDSAFDPVSPWSQRAMYAICSDVPDHLQVREQRCWIADFRRWLLDHDQEFPVRRFDNFNLQVQRYVASGDGTATGDMWLNTEGNMRATSLHMKVGHRSSSEQVLEDQKNWRQYVAEKNSKAATPASNAWATSQLWVDMEAYDEALSSAWRVCLLTVLAVALASLLYTQDFELVGGLVVLAFLIFVGSLFIMLCIFQWQFGPWEMVIMSLFLSYTAEPALHICWDFLKPAGPAAAPPATPASGGNVAPVAPTNGDAEPVGLPVCDDTEGSTSAVVRLVDAPPPEDEAAADGAAVGAAIPSDGVSEASSGGPSGKEISDVLERSVYITCDAVMASSVQLFLCGFMLNFCEFRLFTRVGAVAMMVPFFWVPATLLLLPAGILLSGRTRREPDIPHLKRLFMERVTAASA